MFLRLALCLGSFCVVADACAQHDSMLLDSVTVYGQRDADFLAGSRITRIDTALSEQQSSRPLGELLAFQFPVYFRNYGNGMLSSISMRGTSPQHVAVRWNGINVNSFSLGQSDFSILPAVAFENIEVHEGAGSARFGSGAFGGSILLSSSAITKQIISVTLEAGSFGRYFSSIKGSFSAGKLSGASGFYYIQADNDFPVKETGERQRNASYKQLGFLQSFSYKLNKANNLSAHYWYHDATRKIQPSIGNSSGKDKQDDASHRLSISYDHQSKIGKLHVGGGLVDDIIIFNGDKSEVLRWITSATHQYVLKGNWILSTSSEWNHIVGKTQSYGPDDRIEDRVDVAAALLKQFRRVSASFNLRKPFITHVNAPLLPYLGAEVIVWEKEKRQVKVLANVSRNFRAPTLNDRYWQDAGREDLLPESTYAGEAGVEWNNEGHLSLKATGFYQQVDDWIQWVPGANGIFRPQNIKTVVASGMEVSAGATGRVGTVSIFGKLSYQLTRSVTESTRELSTSSLGKQLPYTPVHTGAGSFGLTYRTWSANIFVQYSGKRYTEASNSSLYTLDPFVLADVTLAKSWKFQAHDLALNFIIKNVFDINYRLYAGHAMPGSNLNVRLSYQLNREYP